MKSLSDALGRRWLPRALVALSRIDGPARTAATVRRALGLSARVELYFAFDDPCSAVAVLDLVERVGHRKATLELLPVVERGIPDDPALERKRNYAVTDARRLAERAGLTLGRAAPLSPKATAFLAEWVSGAPRSAALTSFCTDALRRVWLDGDGALDRSELETLWRDRLGGEPRPDDRRLRRNERRMRRRGPYETPAAWIHGRWYFAHDRLVQIGERLDELGWGAAA